MAPSTSILIPTRARVAYLEVALASLAPQASRAGAELVVIDDAGPSESTRALVARFGARYRPHDRPRGLNAARNTGIESSTGELVVFVDDDIRAREGWLEALLGAARANPGVDVFGGRIVAVLEGRTPRACGREAPPITHLDLGPADIPTRFAWGSNMAIRRDALERVGPFDESLESGGDEQEWQERMQADSASPPTLYVAGATVEHRRDAADARLRSLSRSAYTRGMATRTFDVRRGQAPGRTRELATLAGCLAHVLRYRCPAGIVTAAHSCGRVVRALRERRQPASPLPWTSLRAGRADEDFLSGASGTVGGMDSLLRQAMDELAGTAEVLSGRRARLGRAARSAPPSRRVLALSVVRPERLALAQAIERELLGSRHRVELFTTPPGVGGKFENLNRLLAGHPAESYDWLLVLDDDVELPGGFVDRLLFLCERFSLSLAQPAHRLNSHAAWDVTRRSRGSIVRETSFVEIGPVTAFANATFPVLLPFPDLRMGWGLDLHWAALAREHGWRCGVIDALPIRHRAAPAGADYPRAEAIAEARAFLAERPYLDAAEAQRTLATHDRW